MSMVRLEQIASRIDLLTTLTSGDHHIFQYTYHNKKYNNATNDFGIITDF